MQKVSSITSKNLNQLMQNMYTWSIFYNVKEHGAIGNGEIDDYPAINGLINQTIQGNALVIFPKGEYLIRSNMTVPPNVFLYFVGEGLLKPDTGVTITINGGIIAGPYPIFVGDGNTDGSNALVEQLYPQWWGAKGDGVRDDTTSIAKIRNMASPGQKIWFIKGEYLVTDVSLTTSPSNKFYIGDSWASTIKYNNQSYPIPAYGVFSGVIPDKVIISDPSGALSTSNITPAELSNLQGLSGNVQAHISDGNIHVTAEKKAEWDSKAPGSTAADLQTHVNNANIHVTAAQKTDWSSKAPGTVVNDLQAHVTDAGIHVTPSDKLNWNNKAPGSVVTDLQTHVSNSTIHVTAEDKTNWNSKAPGSTATDLSNHMSDTVAHLTAVEHNKLTNIQEGAEKNQNAFAIIKVDGGTEVLANVESALLTIAGGLGISISANAATRTVTITATGEAAPAPHASTHLTGGSDPIPVATVSSDGLMSSTDVQALASALSSISGINVDISDIQTAMSSLNSDLNAHKSDTAAHGATSTPTANRIAMYGTGGVLKAAVPVASDDVARKAEIDDLKSSVSDGKATVAAAITGKGVPTAADAPFQTMANNIGSIVTDPSGDATATAADLLAGKTAYSQYQKITGTMPNRTGHVTGQSISRSGTTLRIRPQDGKYPGDAANSVQWNDPNWIAANIREGVGLFGLTGTMPYRVLAEGEIGVSRNPTPLSGYYYWVLQVRGLSFKPKWIYFFNSGLQRVGGIRDTGNGVYLGSYIGTGDEVLSLSASGSTIDYATIYDDGFDCPVYRRTSGTTTYSMIWHAGV